MHVMPFVILLIATIFGGVPQIVQAHPIDAAFLDFGPSASGTVQMTVAIHDHEAYELVRPPGDTRKVDLDRLRDQADLVTAYVASHIATRRGGADCDWDPAPAHVPETEFDAAADGITVAGPLTCPGEGSVLDVGSSLFLERFPLQAVIVRRESPSGFIEQAVLSRDTQTVRVDVSPVLTLPAPATALDRPFMRIPLATAAGVVILGALFGLFRKKGVCFLS